MIFDCKVLNSNGSLKKIISSKELIKKHQTKYNFKQGPAPFSTREPGGIQLDFRMWKTNSWINKFKGGL